jgi:hypothetical protein
MFGEAGQVLSMSYIPLVSPLAPKSCEDLDPVPESAELTSKISYETPTPGPSWRARSRRLASSSSSSSVVRTRKAGAPPGPTPSSVTVRMTVRSRPLPRVRSDSCRGTGTYCSPSCS